jgi:hypothetical protein
MASKKGLVAPGYDGDPLLLAGRAFRPDGTAYRYGDLTLSSSNHFLPGRFAQRATGFKTWYCDKQ